MKILLLSFLLLGVASAAVLRPQRDVSDLAVAYDYQQPEVKFSPAEPEEEISPIATTEQPAEQSDIATTAEPSPVESAVLGNDGYEYRSVRRLKYRHRQRRDVSHLSSSYLPPSPSNEYLPPPAEQESVTAPTNEYLPPAEAAAVTEEPVTEAVETAKPEDNAVVNQSEVEEEPQDSAVLRDDGYHYKQAVQEPELGLEQEQEPQPEQEQEPQPEPQPEPEQEPEEPLTKEAPSADYLPPAAAEAEGPAESAVLASDGYHYRAVKRFRF